MSNVAVELTRLASVLPSTSVSMMFAYGSGVLRQWRRSMENAMVDFIVVVDKPYEWHRENLQHNSDHYSLVRLIGAHHLANLQAEYAAKMYCNTMIRINGRLIKYSVIGTDDCLEDLCNWQSMYISGRLHKPVHFVVPPKTDELRQAYRLNLESAVHAALLLLPETFDQRQLFTTITSLSYMGDPRWWFAEDRHKVRNIVMSNAGEFAELYRAPLQTVCQRLGVHREGTTFQQSLRAADVSRLLELLPRNVLCQAEQVLNPTRRLRAQSDLEDIVNVLAQHLNYPSIVRKAIERIVFNASFAQSAKNALTAGFVKSIVYGFRKLLRMVNSYLKS